MNKTIRIIIWIIRGNTVKEIILNTSPDINNFFLFLFAFSFWINVPMNVSFNTYWLLKVLCFSPEGGLVIEIHFHSLSCRVFAAAGGKQIDIKLHKDT